jgi:hypothetical protein
MLLALAGDLDREGVRLVVAGDVGRVRDILRRAGDGDGQARSCPTVEAAVDALRS